jgi:hypothetical protein
MSVKPVSRFAPIVARLEGRVHDVVLGTLLPVGAPGDDADLPPVALEDVAVAPRVVLHPEVVVLVAGAEGRLHLVERIGVLLVDRLPDLRRVVVLLALRLGDGLLPEAQQGPDLRSGEAHQEADDHDHHHDLDQGEASLVAFPEHDDHLPWMEDEVCRMGSMTATTTKPTTKASRTIMAGSSTASARAVVDSISSS